MLAIVLSLEGHPGCSSANRNPENLLAKGVWWKAGVRRSYVVSQGTTEICQEHKKKQLYRQSHSSRGVQGDESMIPVS